MKPDYNRKKTYWTKLDRTLSVKHGWGLSRETLLAGANRSIINYKIVMLGSFASDVEALNHVFNNAFFATGIPNLPGTAKYAQVCMKAIKLCCLKEIE